jgi:PAS domain S-box-containing protein
VLGIANLLSNRVVVSLDNIVSAEMQQMLDELISLRAKVTRLEQAEAASNRSQSILAGQKRVLELIAVGASLSEVLTTLVLLIEQQSSGALCTILLLDETGEHLSHVAAPSLPLAYIQAIDGSEIGPMVGSCGHAAFTGQLTIDADISTSPAWQDYRELALSFGLQACWSAPIFATTGKVLGTFAVYYHQPRVPYPQDLELIQLGSSLAGITIERKQAEAALEASEARYRLLSETVPQVAWQADSQGQVQYFNQRWYEYTGQTVEQARNSGWQVVLHPDDLERTQATWQQAVQNGTLYNIECRLRHTSGKFNWFLARGLPFKNEAGVITAWFGTYTYIDDQKELDYLKDLFVSIASHELRTPLALVSGYAQTLQYYLDKQELASNLTKPLQAVQNIIEQTGRMEDLVTQLLDFGRLQNQKLELNYSAEVDLAVLVANLVEQHQLLVNDHQIVLEIESSSTLVVRKLDTARLAQVLHNLLTNAVKYSPENTTITVGVQRDYAADKLVVWVRDQGFGISLEHQLHIFDRFYRERTQQNKHIEGLGLGLYLSHEIVIQHGGRMWLESTLGQGSTFFFSLPVG